MSSENPKPHFMVKGDVTTYNDLNYPLNVTPLNMEGETLRELRSRMDGVEAVTIGQSKELGKKIVVRFGDIMELNAQTGEYSPLQKGTRGWLSRLFGHISPVMPSTSEKNE